MSGFSSRGRLQATATLDFPDTLAQTASDLTITVPGAQPGDCATICPPAAAVTANAIYSSWVSAVDTVTVRFSNFGLVAANPGPGSFTAIVQRVA